MYLVLDLETTSEDKYGRVANPFYNKILCIGLKYEQKEAIGLNQDYMPKDWLVNVDVIIGHNIKFDLLYLWNTEELQNFFKRGGKVYCTQLAEFILTAQQHKYPSLRDIAVNKYGGQEREKLLEKYKIKGKLDTTLVPINELLIDVINDVRDTEQVALGQLKLAKKQKQLRLIKAHMDGLLATTEMEFNGMKIDKVKLHENKQKLEQEIKIYEEELNLLVTQYWKI